MPDTLARGPVKGADLYEQGPIVADDILDFAGGAPADRRDRIAPLQISAVEVRCIVDF